MVSLLFGIESTVFSLVYQKAQTQLSSLSYCRSVSSVLCFLAPEFPTAPEPFLNICLLFSSHLCISVSASCSPLSLKLCWPLETQLLFHPGWEDFSVFLSSSRSLQHFEPLSWHLSTCLPVYLFHWATKKGEIGEQCQCAKEVCWGFFPSFTLKWLLWWIVTSMWN